MLTNYVNMEQMINAINLRHPWHTRRACKLASFKGDQRPYCSNAASHVSAAVSAHVDRIGRSDAALR